jgi:two-component system sensor histidine kinase PilS (NtrC family)
MTGAAHTLDDWRLLRLLGLYRLLLVAAMLILQETGHSPEVFLAVEPAWYRWTSYLYAMAALGLMLLVQWGRPLLTAQTHLQFLTDLCAITALVYASGGVDEGLAALLLIPAVGCALILSPRMALLQAALATFAMFGEEFLRQTSGPHDPSAYTPTGVLGLILFGTTFTANAVAQRARHSEALIKVVGSEFENLSRLHENIVESMQTGVLALDSRRRIRTLNAAARELLRATHHAEGRALALEAPELDARVERWIRDALMDEGPMMPAKGSPEVVVRISRLGWGADAPILVLLDDATRLRQQAQQIKLAALGRLSASIAHEIRNPLTAISHAGQLLAEAPEMSEGSENRRLLGMIQRHSERIERIVRDVLALSRRDNAAPSSILMRSWLARAVVLYRDGGPRRSGRIEMAEFSSTLRVRFDTDHLQQVLFNLLDNAFTHAAASGREVLVTLRSGVNVGGQPWLDVSDNGPGVAPELLDRIFEPFFTTATQGTGLGLYLTRELCEYNQAQISYRQGSVGACFRIAFAPGAAA